MQLRLFLATQPPICGTLTVCVIKGGSRSRFSRYCAEELDPLSPVICYVASDMYLCRGDDEEVLKRVQKIREIDPESPFAIRTLADYYLVKSDYTQALTSYRKLKELHRAIKGRISIHISAPSML